MSGECGDSGQGKMGRLWWACVGSVVVLVATIAWRDNVAEAVLLAFAVYVIARGNNRMGA